MPFLFRIIRRDSVSMGHLRKYSWYAIGEIVLIFFGITLALAFDDWSEERRLRDLETASLQDIAENLRANIDLAASNMQFDSRNLNECRKAIVVVEERLAWQPENGTLFQRCRYWTSPYLQSAAYDSLKARGTDLLSNPRVKTGIVKLYEDVYANLVGDNDREQWEFHVSVFFPVWNRYIRTLPDGTAMPSNYDTLLASEEFLNVLYNRSDLLRRSIAEQEKTLANTQEVLVTIEDELASRISD